MTVGEVLLLSSAPLRPDVVVLEAPVSVYPHIQ